MLHFIIWAALAWWAIALVLALFAKALIAAVEARDNARDQARLRRRTRQHAWDEKMLTTEWGQEITAAREAFLRDPPVGDFDNTRRTRWPWRGRARQTRYRGPIVIFSRATWSWLVPAWRSVTAPPAATHSTGRS